MLKRLKIFSILALVISLLYPICVSAYYSESDMLSHDEGALIYQTNSFVDPDGMLPLNMLATAKLSPEDIPEVLRIRDADTSNYVHRVYTLENEYSLVYQNSDGTNTVLQFNEPIKYRNADGKLKDKSTKTTLVGRDYVMYDNDVLVKIPNKLSDGVMVAFDGLKISMKPVGTSPDMENVKKLTVNAEKLSANTAKYSYSKTYDANTDIVYTPIFDGVKCDIILQEYNEKREFEFEVDLNGFTLEKDENEKIIYILNSLGEKVAYFGTVMSYDSLGKVSFGDMTFKYCGNGKYSISLLVDEEFLADPDTVYPVTVDPTVKTILTYDTNVSFEYLCVYSNGSTIHSTSYTTADMLVGSSSNGNGRILFRIDTDQFINAYTPKTITKVELMQCVRSSTVPTYAVYAYPFIGNHWEDTSSYNNISPNSYDSLCPIGVTYSQYGTNTQTAKMDITWFLKNVESNAYPNYSADKGIIFVNINGEQAPLHIASYMNIAVTNQDNINSLAVACFRPYVQITYEPYKIMLDPGHVNGKTVEYYYNGIQLNFSEGRQMWKLYTYLRQNLKNMGFNVGVTRTETIAPDFNEERGDLAAGYDMFLSLHSNAKGMGNATQTSSCEVMYECVIGESQEVIDFADAIATKVKNAMNINQSNRFWPHNHPAIEHAKLAGCPIAILIEHSYHDNPQYTYKLMQDSVLSSIAAGEADAIHEFFVAKLRNNFFYD